MSAAAKALPSSQEMQAAADALYRASELLEDLSGRMPDPESDPHESEWEPVTAARIGGLYGAIEDAALYADAVGVGVERLRKALSLASSVRTQQEFTRQREAGDANA